MFSSRARTGLVLVAVAAVLAVTAAPGGADADDGPEIVATGLDQPRGLDITARGDLYIAEAGSGGDLEEVGFFAGALHCTGLTGAITRVDKKGNQERIVDGLPSAGHCDGGQQGLGPAGVLANGRRQVVIQMGSTASFDPNAVLTVGADRYGRVLQAGDDNTIRRTIADVTSFEAASDPDGEGYDSNPTDIARYRGGYVVTDAGANAVHVIDRWGRLVRTVLVPQDPCPGGAGNCFGDPNLDSVPTGITRGRGSTFYISTLSGVVADFTQTPPAVGFQPGNGKIFAFDARTGEITEFAGDLTTVIDVAYDRRDRVVYAAEFLTGAVWRIDVKSGERTRVDTPGDLVTPGGLAVDRKGDLYVSVFTAAPGKVGQVVRYDL